MASAPGTLRFGEILSTPPAPPVGYALIYVKTDNVVYLQDSSGVEVPLGSASAITQLVGEASASGPGVSTITLSNAAIIGKVLTGFVAGPNSVVLSTDTILEAIEKLQAQVSSTSGSAITSLTGDVSASGPGAASATVNVVGGKSAASIATSVNDTQAATSINTASTIVKRDASGNFAANIITSSLVGNVTGSASNNVLKAGDTITGTLFITAPGTALDVTNDVQIGGDLNVTGTITAANLSGNNTGDVTITDTNSIDLTLSGQNLSADLRLADTTLSTVAGGVKVNLIDNINVNPGIDAAKISTGVVSNAEFNYLDGVTSSIQTQLNNKASTTHASTHLPSGSDPLTTAAPLINLDASTSNSAGLAESFSKSDHSHAISTGVVSTIIPNQTNVAGSSANLTRADHIHNIPSGSVVQIGTSNFDGAAASFALSDHVHSHGNQTNGLLHAIVTTSVNGFMSAVDKTKLDAATNLNTPSTIVMRDSSGNFSAGIITANLTGNSTGFTGSLLGDVTGTQGATIVSTVGGKTSSQIATSVNDTLAATNLSTVSTIVKRDASGATHLKDLQLDGSTSGALSVLPAASTTSHSIIMPASQGAAGTFLSNDGSGNLSWTNPVVNIDGGTSNSVYTAGQFINGGTP